MEPGKSIRIKHELEKPTQSNQDCTRFYTARFRFGKAQCRLPRRHGNVVMPAWQRCYAGMATLLRRHGNVVTAAWQRATRHVDTGTAYYVMDLWVIKTAKVNGKNRVFHLCSMCVVFVQVLYRNACTPFLINSAISIKKNPLFSGNVVYEKSGGGVVKSGR